MLNLYKIESHNYVNGKGCRYVIWVQGCTFHCKGCWNQETWDCSNNHLKSVESIFSEIKALDDIDGVTFVGGEPLLQSSELLKLAELIKNQTSLGIQIFTGFEPEEPKTDIQMKLLNAADTIVMGRFDSTKINNNQKVFNNSSNIWNFNNTDVEIDLDENLNISVTGYPTDILLNTLKGKN